MREPDQREGREQRMLGEIANREEHSGPDLDVDAIVTGCANTSIDQIAQSRKIRCKQEQGKEPPVAAKHSKSRHAAREQGRAFRVQEPTWLGEWVQDVVYFLC